MALDSLGLGLTLDTTLLEKADKTLENMQKNSKLIMQNLTRGFTAFNEGKISDFSQVFDNIQKSMQKLKDAKVSVDFDTAGFEKGLDLISQITLSIEKIQSAGTKQFFDPTNIYTTSKSMKEAADEVSRLKNEMDAVHEAMHDMVGTQEELNALISKMAEIKLHNPSTFAENQEFMDALARVDEINKAKAAAEAKYGDIEGVRMAERQLVEKIEIAKKELEWTKMTKAQQMAAVVSYNQRIIADEKKRTTEVESLYKNNFTKMNELLKQIDQLEKDRQKVAAVGGDTSEYDKNLTFLRDELNRRIELEEQIVKTDYPKIAKIKQEMETEEFIKASKERAKLAEQEQRRDVSYANQFSKNASSVEEEAEAVRLLAEARDKLSYSTAHYDSIVAALNKRIAKHEDHIKLLTHEQKESNTLMDSVISRYIREKKEIRELNKLLKELHEKQASTGVKTAEEDKYEQDIIARRQRLWNDVNQIETDNAKHIAQLREKFDASVSEEKIKETLKTNEKEKQEYAKLLDDLYALEKQKKAMEEAGGGVGDKAYDNLLQQEADLNARKSQLEAKHQNDLDEIRKKHAKKRNDDEVKEFIDEQKEKLRIAEEYAKKQREKARKYGTISSASADRLIGATDNAQNVNQHKRAIEKLQQARASLNNTDKDYLKTVKRLNEAIKYHEIEIELTEDKSKKLMQTHRGLMDIGGQLMRRLALVFSVSQLTQYFRKLVEVRGEFEKTEVALTTILKSRAQANVLMNQITDLAVKSPFTLQQLVGYTKQLAAYQIEYKKLYSTTKMLADVSTGLGVEMDRLILAFGQVRAANFLRATEVRQFTEAGFDILGELAKHYSQLKGEMVSVTEVQEMVTRRMVGFGDVEKVFQNVTSAGGIFYDMQAKQAETLAGQWSNLQDKISIMYNEIGKSTDGVLKGIVRFLASIIDNWEGTATVLKSLIAVFAAVKINAALTSKEMIKFARTMGVIKGRRKAVTVLELLGAGFVKLGRSIKAAGVALKSFIVSNPYIAAFTALVGIIGAVVSRNNKLKDSIADVKERYDQLHESITEINGAMLNAINEQDLDKQKDSLKELVDMVDKEYNMKINIDIEQLTPEELAEKFNEIMDEAERLNIFGEMFGSGLEGFKADGQNALKDISQYGEAANDLFKQMVDKSNKVASALQEIDAEKYKDIIKDLVAPRDRKSGESELTYLNRLYGAYMKIKEEGSIDLSWDEDTDQYIARTSENFYELRKILGEIDFSKLSRNYAKALNEFQNVEFVQYLDTLTDSLEGLTDEQKEKKLKFAIDTEAANREWNAFVVQLMYEIANTKFGLHIKPEIEAPDVTKWEKWQENYKKEFENEEGYMRITSPSITQEAQIKALNEEYAKQYDLLERIKKAGGESALGVKGAYAGLGKTMEEITAEMEDLNAQIVYLGGENTTLDKREKASQEILNRRISILKEIHEAYKQARKDDLGHEAAVQKVMKDWGDTFTEAFEGTSINLTSVLVDQEKLAELKSEGERAGIAFSEAMNEKMQQIFDSGTYIRSASKDILEFLKLEEGWRNKAYQDSSGVWTIGAGSTKQKDGKTPIKQGDYWTDDEIWENSQQQIKEHEDRLNRVLEKHRDILLTQEQYNVLLKATWQGQGTSVIPMAKDAEMFKKWLEEIDEMPIVKVLMNPDGTIKERKKVGLFDIDIDAIMQEYNNLESVYERMALVLKYTSNRAGATKDTTQGMIDRSNKRSSDFLGDTEINKLLEKASQTIADFDFSTPEGLVKALRDLMPIAKKEGKEAMLALSKEISKVENEVGVKIRLENVEDFKTDIEKAIGDYKLWKDIEKLQMPEDVAIKMFGVTPKTLQQVREEVLGALNLGDDINLGNEEDVLAAVKLQYGDPTKEVVRNFFKNVNEIQRKETEEQAQRFVKFLTKNLDQTKVIMSQRGIDISFAKKQFDEGKISAQQFAEVVKNIVAQSNEEISKFNLDKFKESPEYIQAMGDLTAYSVSEIKNLIKSLEDVVAANSDAFSADEAKAYIDAIYKAQETLDELEQSPFRWEEFAKIGDIRDTQEEIDEQKKEKIRLQEQEKQQLEELKKLEEELVRLEALKKSIQEGDADDATKTAQLANVQTQIDSTTQAIQTGQEAVAATQNQAKTTESILGKLGDKFKGLVGKGGGAASTVAIIDAIINGINDTVQGILDITNEIGSVMESFGKETDMSTGFGKFQKGFAIFAESSQHAADGWNALKNGDPVGAVVSVVKSVTSIIKGINEYHDAIKEEQIEDHLEEVENLQKDYERLERTIDKAFAFERYGKVAEQTSNLAEQAQNLNKAIALEEDKKNTDPERIKELEGQVEDLENQIEDLFDNLKQELIGSFEDMGDSLANAMIEALKAGEDGIAAWNKEVDEIIAELVKKLTVQKYLEPQISAAIDTLFSRMMPKTAAAEKAAEKYGATSDEAVAAYKKAEGEIPQLDEASVEEFRRNLELIGLSYEEFAKMIAGITGGEGGGLSALEKGIQGMSEDTAQVLAAYWNASRQSLSNIDSKMDIILANMGLSSSDENPMLSQLRLIATQTTAINNLLSSVTAQSSGRGGTGIKVYFADGTL